MALTPLLLLTLFAVPGSASEYAKQIANAAISNESASDDPVEALWNTIRALREEQQLLEGQIAECREEVNGVVNEKKLLDKQIGLFYRELVCMDAILLIYDQQIESYEQKQIQLTRSIDDCRQKLALRLRQSYEEGLPGLLELLASAPDFLSFIIAVERQNQLAEYDEQLMEELNGLYYQQTDLRNGLDRVKAQRHEVALEQAERTRLFNEQLQGCGGFLWDLEGNVNRFSYFIQQSQVGIQYADAAVQKAVNAFVASLDQQKLAEIEDQRLEKLALYTDQIKGSMENGSIQQGGEFFLSGSKYILPLVLTGDRTPAITSVMGYCTYQIGNTVIGDYHGGIDLSATYGTAVVAAASGVVVYAGQENGYGNYLVMWHEDGSLTLYAHLSEYTVSVGDYLLQGEALGIAGSSGNSKGIGCHFELWKDGKRVDPTSVLVFPVSE